MAEKDEMDEKIGLRDGMETASSFDDVSIICLDCELAFIWTAGEREFFRDKGLKHSPKRCKACKKTKTERISINSDRVEKISVSVICDSCSEQTTVPFYPSQGRPVLCRTCFADKSAK